VGRGCSGGVPVLRSAVRVETPGDALFRKCRDRAGIVGLHFHDSRHEAITRLAQRLDVLDLARMVGHRDLKMLQAYYNATAEEIAARLG
jgi:integrase